MPNWVYNTLSIEKKYKDKIVNDKDEVDFGIMVPMPDSLNVEAGGYNDYDIYTYLSEKLTIPLNEVRKNPLSKLIENMFDKDWIKTVSERIKNDKKYIANINDRYLQGEILVNNYKNFGAITWYDWSIQNWGTKWNAGNSDIKEKDTDHLYIKFDTAWSPPHMWLAKFVEQKIPFELEWEEEGGFRALIKHDGSGQATEEELPNLWNNEDED